MLKKATILTLFLGLFLLTGLLVAQEGPIPIVEPVLIDSAVYNGIYTGVQCQLFCEPTTGNLVTAWYRYYSSGPDPRRITAATSIDGGATWTVHENINLGVGDEMNGRFASVWGTSLTPIIAYGDRNPGGDNRSARPTVAYDVGGWGSGAFINIYVDDVGTADTVLYGRYLFCTVSPTDENLWAVGCYHNAAPGRSLYFYRSQDGGNSWTRPRVPASTTSADSLGPNWLKDLSYIGLGLGFDNDNNLFACFRGQWDPTDDNSLWMVLYSTSTDLGDTWSPIANIPGTENVYTGLSDTYRSMSSPILDKAGNWHIFVSGIDTMDANWHDFPQPYRSFDFRFDGSTWTINKFVFPHTFENGIMAWGDYPADVETYNMNEPAIGPDGTLYYAYTDVVDTMGAMGDLDAFNFHIMVMYSEDNGDSWEGPVSVLTDWSGRAPNGMARYATDKLHIVYRKHFESDKADEYYYLGVPTDTIKARATGVAKKVTRIMPDRFALHQNFPNPFNPTTSITFDLLQRSHVTLKIFNEMGQEVATLIDKPMEAGFKGITWYAKDMPSGVYFYQLKAGNFVATKKMILTK